MEVTTAESAVTNTGVIAMKRIEQVGMILALSTLALGCGDIPSDEAAEAASLTTGSPTYHHLPWGCGPGCGAVLISNDVFNCKADLANPPGSQQDMFCCPPGQAIVGQYGLEWMKCKPFAVDPNRLKRFSDKGIWHQEDVRSTDPQWHTTMQACPVGMVMVGLFWDGFRTDFACQFHAPPMDPTHFTSGTFLDFGLRSRPPTQDSDSHPGVPTMHVCPAPTAMTGAHYGKNQFACRSNTFPVIQ